MYAELSTAIIRACMTKFLSLILKSSSSCGTTSFVQNLIEPEKENEVKDKDSITKEELFAMAQLFEKDKGKGKSNGNGKGVCWHCGHSEHCSRDCPNEKEDSWTETMSCKGPQDSIMRKGSSKGWNTGKSSWNICKDKGKRLANEVWQQGQSKHLQCRWNY